MTRLDELVSEPLVHFLIGGALLLLAFSWLGREGGIEEDARRIVVAPDVLRDFVASRTQLVDPLALVRARALLAELNQRGSVAAEALALGDRFLYSQSYVDRTLAEVSSHFGDAMAATLATLEPDTGRWTGLHRSDHGLHLILLTAREPVRIPPLEEIQDALAEELRRERRERLLDEAIDEIVSRYRVEIDADTAR